MRSNRPSCWLRIGLLLACTGLAGCKTDLYSHLDEKQANEIVAILRDNGLSAERRVDKDKTITVSVDDGGFAAAVEILKSRGYPRQVFSNMGEIFNSGSLIVSPTEERAKMMYALSEELARTISAIDGVLTARVHIVLEESDLLHQNSKPSAAAVFIRYSSVVPADNFLPQIKMLVANAVSGVTYDKVSVILIPITAPQSSPRSPIAQLSNGEFKFPTTALAGIGAALLVLVGAIAIAVLRRPQTVPKPEILE